MLRKIYNYFYPQQLIRSDVIKGTLRVPFDSLILKYDYFLTPEKLSIFDKYDGMLAMTVLPNGQKLIAYNKSLRIWGTNESFSLLDLPYIYKLIAVSNDEIIILFGADSGIWINFRTNQIIMTFKSPVYDVFVISEDLIIAQCKTQIKIFDRKECISTFDDVLCGKILKDKIIILTNSFELIVWDFMANKSEILLQGYFLKKYFVELNNVIYIRGNKILINFILFDLVTHEYEYIHYGYREGLIKTVVLDNRVIFVYPNSCGVVVNLTTHQFEREITYYDGFLLPNNHSINMSINGLHIYDFDKGAYTTIKTHSRYMNDKEARIKFQLLN